MDASVAASPAFTPLTSPVRVTVVGSGTIGDLTRAVVASLEGAEVADMIAARDVTAEALAASDADVVAVCSANGLHTEHALLAIGAGCHVVVEKPLALSVADGRRVLEAAAARGVSVSVVSQRRDEPLVRTMRDAVASGVLGTPVLAECLMRWRRDADYYAESPWRGTRDLDGGVLFNQGIHGLDLLRWMLGPVASVSAHHATRVWPIEAPDTATATMRFVSGALGVLSATVASASPGPAELNLHFEHGTIRLHDDELVEWNVPGIDEPRADDAVGSGAQDPSAIGQVGHRRQWERIIAALQAGQAPEVTGADALGTAALVAAIHDSAARDGAPVTPEVA